MALRKRTASAAFQNDEIESLVVAKSKDFSLSLSVELWDNVFHHLTPTDLISTRKVCQLWRSVVKQMEERDRRFKYVCGSRCFYFDKLPPTEPHPQVGLNQSLQDVLMQIHAYNTAICTNNRAWPCTCGRVLVLGHMDMGNALFNNHLDAQDIHHQPPPARWQQLHHEYELTIKIGNLARTVDARMCTRDGYIKVGSSECAWLPLLVFLPENVRRPTSKSELMKMMRDTFDCQINGQAGCTNYKPFRNFTMSKTASNSGSNESVESSSRASSSSTKENSSSSRTMQREFSEDEATEDTMEEVGAIINQLYVDWLQSEVSGDDAMDVATFCASTSVARPLYLAKPYFDYSRVELTAALRDQVDAIDNLTKYMQSNLEHVVCMRINAMFGAQVLVGLSANGHLIGIMHLTDDDFYLSLMVEALGSLANIIFENGAFDL